jgi:4-aminobutyrate aminotransferase/(S)-3-amino-2-methylpropionate transaminase
MLAMEFVQPGTTEPDAEIVKRIIAGCRAEGVLVLSAGTYGNVVRLLPPLVIGEELLLEAVDVLAEVTRAAAAALHAASPS